MRPPNLKNSSEIQHGGTRPVSLTIALHILALLTDVGNHRFARIEGLQWQLLRFLVTMMTMCDGRRFWKVRIADEVSVRVGFGRFVFIRHQYLLILSSNMEQLISHP